MRLDPPQSALLLNLVNQISSLNCTTIQVLLLEPHNIKALFRRAQAYLETADLDRAEMDLKKALEIDPNNGFVLMLRLNKNLLSIYA